MKKKIPKIFHLKYQLYATDDHCVVHKSLPDNVGEIYRLENA